MTANRGLRHRLRRIERQITEQHARLAEFHRVLNRAIAARAKADARVAFGAYRIAIEAHFDLEERLLYPSIASLDPDRKDQLGRFGVAHNRFLDELRQLSDQLESSIDDFASHFANYTAFLIVHERQEEELVTSLAR